MAAISPAFARADRVRMEHCAGATDLHNSASRDTEPRRGDSNNSPGHHSGGRDSEPRRGDSNNSPGREPRDSDPCQHLLSPARAAQSTLPWTPRRHSHPASPHPTRQHRDAWPTMSKELSGAPIEIGQKWTKADILGHSAAAEQARRSRFSMTIMRARACNPTASPPAPRARFSRLERTAQPPRSLLSAGCIMAYTPSKQPRNP